MYRMSIVENTKIDVIPTICNPPREKHTLESHTAARPAFFALNRLLKKSRYLLLALSAGLATTVGATEGGRDNTSAGSETFFTVPPGITPGVYLNSYYYHYSASHFGPTPKFHATIDALGQRLVYITPWKFLGARLATYGFATLYDQRIRAYGISNHRTSFSDLTVAPSFIWDIKHKLGLATGVEITLPSGQYNDKEVVNAGLNYYTYKPFVAFTWMPTSRTEFSMRNTYSFNTTNHDTHYHSGQVYHFDFSASYRVLNDLHAGLNGYYLKQTTNDKLRGDVYEDGYRGRVFAVGPAVHYMFSHEVTLEARWMKEFKVQNRPCGDALWLKLLIAHL